MIAKRAKQRGDGFRKPINRTSKPVGLAMVKDDPGYMGGTVGCSCGWEYTHPRKRVRDKAGDKHVDTKHAGRGIWL